MEVRLASGGTLFKVYGYDADNRRVSVGDFMNPVQRPYVLGKGNGVFYAENQPLDASDPTGTLVIFTNGGCSRHPGTALDDYRTGTSAGVHTREVSYVIPENMWDDAGLQEHFVRVAKSEIHLRPAIVGYRAGAAPALDLAAALRRSIHRTRAGDPPTGMDGVA